MHKSRKDLIKGIIHFLETDTVRFVEYEVAVQFLQVNLVMNIFAEMGISHCAYINLRKG